MTRKSLSIPELALISGTRAMLGAGVGLLLAERLSDDARRAAGCTLLAVGLITTIPIVAQLFADSEAPEEPHATRSSSRLARYAF